MRDRPSREKPLRSVADFPEARSMTLHRSFRRRTDCINVGSCDSARDAQNDGHGCTRSKTLGRRRDGNPCHPLHLSRSDTTTNPDRFNAEQDLQMWSLLVSTPSFASLFEGYRRHWSSHVKADNQAKDPATSLAGPRVRCPRQMKWGRSDVIGG